MSRDFPYADRFVVNRTLPEHGRPREEVLDELRQIAKEEDAFWETGKCSGTMYCGDHGHYEFLNEAFGLYAHVNVLQRDICPSATRFEGEIIAMALDLMHAEAVTGTAPAGLVTTGGTGSILHALLAYRDHAAQTRGIRRPNFIKPETGHPAFDKACHLFGIELRRAPIDAVTTQVDVGWVADHIDDETIAILGSACNYGYGTIDPISELSALALERGVGLHVDGCLGGFILPFGQELGYDIPLFDFRLPGVTSISADTHKYGYAFKGSSTLLFRDSELRNSQYFFLPDWTGGKYGSPGIEGSRSGGLLASTWASMVQLGRAGYRDYAEKIFATAGAMKDAVRSHPELRILGNPTFCFSFTSDEFDIYHVNDSMRPRGWRFNGQQYPNAIHMAVTRPQTQPGVTAAFAGDLVAAVRYAKKQQAEGSDPFTGAIYGGVAGGMTDEADELIRAVMADMFDTQQSVPPRSMPVGPAAEELVLAVDLGTGGPKVGFVSVTGTVAWQDHIAIETTWLDDGGAVQDADAWWRVIGDAVRRAVAGGAVTAERVVAASITGQWASTVPVDESGRPVGDCIMWMDKRGGRFVRPIVGGRVGGYAPKNAATWIRRTGALPSPGGGDPIGHMLFLQHERPAIADAARWMLEPVDYLSMRLTGEAAASPASMVAAWLTDNRQLDQLAYDDKLVAMAGVDASKLPPLHRTGSVVGTVRADVATELGLPSGVQVVTATPDLHSATCGAGAIGDYEAHMAISTTSWISAPVPFKKTDLLHSIASIPGVTADRYLIVNNHDTSGRCLEWLRDNVLGASYDELIEMAASAPPGSGDVLFTPWLNGERSPIDDRKARGGFHNVSLQTERADLTRAVLEGVAYNNRWLHEWVEKFAKRRLDPIRVIGGGAKSDLWCQIHADVMDRTIERVHEPLHAGIRGAAIFAGIALGAVRPADVRGLVEVDAVFRPDAANRRVYEDLYAEFPKLYKAQKAMFRNLNGRARRR